MCKKTIDYHMPTILILLFLSLGIIVLFHQIYLYIVATCTPTIIKNAVDYDKKHLQFLTQIQQIGLNTTPINQIDVSDFTVDEIRNEVFGLEDELREYAMSGID
jgi:hypothetical protein